MDCPVAGCVIECLECCDICLAAEGVSPEDEVPVWMEWTDEKAAVCMQCPKHMD